MNEKLTPMMEQYFRIKKEYDHCLLFFRLGDFYELFFDDAITASRELDIVLTGKECGREERAPMCGVPYHSADGYVAKLVSKGYKVAICEQVEDPRLAKTIVRREVIRVVTPGTVTDGNALEEGRNNYILCVYEGKANYGAAACDVSTGEFTTLSRERDGGVKALADEIARFTPAEIIANGDFMLALFDEGVTGVRPAVYDAWKFEYNNAYVNVCNHLGVLNLNGFGLEDRREAVCAAGALLYYLSETQKNSLKHITTIKNLTRGKYMTLDAPSRRNLELTEHMRERGKKGSLLWALDMTRTAMGARLMRQWLGRPLLDAADINYRLDAVEEFLEFPFFREEIKEYLNAVYDIERIMSRMIYRTANARDMISLRDSIEHFPHIKNLVSERGSAMLTDLSGRFDTLADIHSAISATVADEPPFSVREGGFIKRGFDEKLDEYYAAKNEGAAWIVDMENAERERTGIKNLRIRFNKVFGYYIEVTNSYKNLAPEHYIRKQTLANCERYTTEELKRTEEMILTADDKIAGLEYELFEKLREFIAGGAARIGASADVIAALDCLQSLADAAERRRYVKPVVDGGDVIEIKGGRHPVVELAGGGAFIPNDTYLDNRDNRLSIITGPNMAGKSTYMRQVAIIVLMAQIGSFVPAESARIGVVDRIFTRAGASDDLATGQSTFMVEMTEVANILNSATDKSLLILDEIGRGTSTYDGLSIAWAVMEHIADKRRVGAKTLFATHYHELTELEGKVGGVKNFYVTVSESDGEVVFLRKVARGGAQASYGIHVAKLAGIPEGIIARSGEILDALNSADIAGKRRTDGSRAGVVYYNKPKKTPDERSGGVVLSELNSLDVDGMSPREALVALYRLKDSAGGKGK